MLRRIAMCKCHRICHQFNYYSAPHQLGKSLTKQINIELFPEGQEAGFAVIQRKWLSAMCVLWEKEHNLSSGSWAGLPCWSSPRVVIVKGGEHNFLRNWGLNHHILQSRHLESHKWVQGQRQCLDLLMVLNRAEITFKVSNFFSFSVIVYCETIFKA